MENIEQVQLERDSFGYVGYSVDPFETSHEMLEWDREARCVRGDYFAFQNCFVGLDVAFHGLNDFWEALRGVCEASAENSHFIVQLVDLDSCAIVLVLERCLTAMRFQSFVNVVGYFCQHGFYWSEDSEAKNGQGLFAACFG